MAALALPLKQLITRSAGSSIASQPKPLADNLLQLAFLEWHSSFPSVSKMTWILDHAEERQIT
jgi:hypothetical protein